MNTKHIKFECIDNPNLVKRYISIGKDQTFSIDNKTFFGPKMIIITENKPLDFCKINLCTINDLDWKDLIQNDLENNNWRLVN